jgi:hypothetical protein
MLEELKWNGWLKVSKLPFGLNDADLGWFWVLSLYKFGHVLSALDLLTHPDIHYIVLDLCDAGQPAYYRCGVYGAFRINFHLRFCLSSVKLFEQAIALLNMIRSISVDLYLRK